MITPQKIFMIFTLVFLAIILVFALFSYGSLMLYFYNFFTAVD